MRLTTLDRELARLAPTPNRETVSAAHARVMAAVAGDRRTPPAPDDSDGRVISLDRARPVRRVAFRLGIAASLVAASVAGVTLWPHPADDWVPAAYADWRAFPEPLPPDEARVRADVCLTQATEPGPDDGLYPIPSVAGLGPVVAERRGSSTFLLLADRDKEGRAGTVMSCLSSRSGDAISSFAGSGSDLPPDRIQPRATTGVGDQVSMWGEAGDDVSRVTATLPNGTVVDATISGGYFAAWWPSDPNYEGIEAYTLTWYLTDGTQGGTYDSPSEP